jgi:hypothetical protein
VTTRRQAAANRHVTAAQRHVSVMVNLMPQPVPKTIPGTGPRKNDVHLPEIQQSVNSSPVVLAKQRAKALKQATVIAARKKEQALRRQARAESKERWMLTGQMLRREERAALRWNRKKTIRFRVVHQIKGRHSTGVNRRVVNTAGVSRLAVRAQMAQKARRARLWTFLRKDGINLLGGEICPL